MTANAYQLKKGDFYQSRS